MQIKPTYIAYTYSLFRHRSQPPPQYVIYLYTMYMTTGDTSSQEMQVSKEYHYRGEFFSFPPKIWRNNAGLKLSYFCIPAGDKKDFSIPSY